MLDVAQGPLFLSIKDNLPDILFSALGFSECDCMKLVIFTTDQVGISNFQQSVMQH